MTTMPPEIQHLRNKLSPAARAAADQIDIVLEVLAPHLKEQAAKIAALEKRLAEIESKGVQYLGVWQRAAEYRRGSMVTHDGSVWAAVKDIGPDEKPGAGTSWQLAVRAGRDSRS